MIDIKSTLFQILLFTAVALIFGSVLATISLIVQKIFGIGGKSKVKHQVYECGVRALGKSQVQFDIKYYIFALMFIVFDVEFVFLLPWALSVAKSREVPLFAIIEAFVFILILGLGWYYAWRKGALEWDK